MSKFFFAKFAFTNLKKNHQIYIPYIISSIVTIAMFFIMITLTQNKQIQMTKGGNTLIVILEFATYIIGIFAVILLFYTNSFLMKRRNKEMGLYHVLGLEKKHISIIFLFETIFVAAISIGLGIIFGFILEKFMLLLLMKLIFFKIALGSMYSLKAILDTILLFVGIYFIIFLSHIVQIKKMKPIELLGSDKIGEKEPKSKILIASIGMIALLSGYGITFTVKNPIDAISTFFLAILLVIVGTYCIFTSGSIVFLKFLRKNKSYYYKTKNFISLSSMMYRMKQNAWGLASICILSSAVILTISTTVSIYCGVEDVLKYRFPYEMQISMRNSTSQQQQELLAKVENQRKEQKIVVDKEFDFLYGETTGQIENGKIIMGQDMLDISSKNKYAYFRMIPLEDYNKITKKKVTLKENEMLLYHVPYKDTTVKQDTHLILDDTLYKSVGSCKDFPVIDASYADYYTTYYMVLKDPNQILTYMNKSKKEPVSTLEFSYYGNYKNKQDVKDIFVKKLTQQLQNQENIYLSSRDSVRSEFYTVYGTIFFIGIFLGVLFLGATTLIIYYKQISEGFEDRNRYIIMQKIGLSKKEIRQSIRSQILKVFIFPLLMAVIHIIVAFHIMTKLLALFGLTNIWLFMICTVFTIVCFCLCYVFVYMTTAKTYFKLVHQKN